MAGQLKRYAFGGTLFVLFLLGVGGFMADFIPRYDTTASTSALLIKTQNVSASLNGTMSSFTTQAENIGTGNALQNIYLLGTVLDLFKMPFTMAGYIVDITTELLAAVGIPIIYAQLLLLLIVAGAGWAFLDAAQGRDA